MSKLFTIDLTNNQMISDEPFLIFDSKKNITKSGSEYYKLEIGDKTGRITAMIWEDSIPNCNETELKEGNIVNIWGKVEEYKGAKQIKILSTKPAENYKESDFISASKRNPKKMWEEFIDHVASIRDKNIKSLIKKIFEDEKIKTKFKNFPAAERIHHAYKHGLLEHVLEMLDMAEPICNFYPEADKSLVKAGIILHDIGKIIELEDNTISYLRTIEGNLIGHLILGYELVLKYLDTDFPEFLKIKLKHIILSHHGEQEFGSPVKPMIIEAIIVSQVDNLSSKTRQYQRILDENAQEQGEFSSRDPFLGTKVYLK
ncbi:HD domain-containing protein [Candidatus Dojkabacteria bacterium]|nr:HD domain-containing protein [Candidatus Dojkabacteria bacterium]